MRKKSKIIITFILSFIISFFIVGYVKNTMFVAIDWVEGATIWSKFREYYIRTFWENIIPSFILSILFTTILTITSRKKAIL